MKVRFRAFRLFLEYNVNFATKLIKQVLICWLKSRITYILNIKDQAFSLLQLDFARRLCVHKHSGNVRKLSNTYFLSETDESDNKTNECIKYFCSKQNSSILKAKIQSKNFSRNILYLILITSMSAAMIISYSVRFFLRNQYDNAT